MHTATPRYRSSFEVLIKLLADEGKSFGEVEVVHADPISVPDGLRPWTTSAAIWQLLQIAGAPFQPAYAAAEVVVGSDWCAANSEWGADDWVLAKRDERLLTIVRETGCDLMRSIIASETVTPPPPPPPTSDAPVTVEDDQDEILRRERLYGVDALFYEETEGTGNRHGPMSVATFRSTIPDVPSPKTVAVDDYIRRTSGQKRKRS